MMSKNKYIQKYRVSDSDRTFRDFLSDWKWIFTYTKKYGHKVGINIVLGLLSSTLGIAVAYFTGILINVISEKQMDRLPRLIGLTVGIMLLSMIVSAFKTRTTAKIELALVKDIQTDLFCKIMDLNWTELKKYKNGDLLNRFNKDMETVMNNAIAWIPNVIINLYTFLLIIILLFKMDIIMALIGLGCAPFVFFMSRFILKRQKEYRKKVLEIGSDMMSFETDSFYNIDSVKAFGVWDVLTGRLENLQKKYTSHSLEYNMFQVKTDICMSLLNMSVAFGALAYCLFRLWSGNILFGDMTFFLTQRGSLLTVFNSLIATVPAMLNASVSAHRMRELIGMPKEKHNSQAYSKMKTVAEKGLSMEVTNLTFSYSDGQKVYENASFSVHPGEAVAVVGESGGGKTTLFRLLLGLIDPDKGQVVIKDTYGNEFDMNADFRNFISYVPQGNTLMIGTIADNIRIMCPDATDDEIIKALKIACAWDFVEKAGGINTMIGERGNGVSEGQAQRIGIARAIVRNAPILLLDEATSALDEETESKVLRNLAENLPNKAVVISTHRTSVLKKCNRVYRISDKKVNLSEG